MRVSLPSIALYCVPLLVGCKSPPVQAPPSPVKVSTVTVAPATVPVSRTFVGQVQSVNLVEVRSKVSGYLIKQSFEEGKVVQEGQELFVIDPKPFQAALDAANAALAEAKARLDVTERNLARAKSLIATTRSVNATSTTRSLRGPPRTRRYRGRPLTSRAPS